MRRILVVIDQDEPDNPAFARACAIAGENCADLGILMLREPRRKSDGAEPYGRFMALMTAARAHHPCIGSIAVSAVAPDPLAIATAAETADADLIVMRNTIDPNVPHDAPFALIDRVVHRTELPLLAVQNPAHRPYRRLVVLTGRGLIGRQALDLALRMKSARDIYAVRANQDETAANEDNALLARLVAAASAIRSDVAVKIHPIVRAGDVQTALIRTWQEFSPDLVAAVTRRRRGIKGLFGPSTVRDFVDFR